MIGSIKVLYLFGRNTLYCITIHLHGYLRVGMPAADTSAGDIVSMFCQILCDKYFIAGFYYSGVIYVYILYEKPSTNAIVCQCTLLFHELHYIVVEQ